MAPMVPAAPGKSTGKRLDQGLDDDLLPGQRRVQAVGHEELGLGRRAKDLLQVDASVAHAGHDRGDGLNIAVEPRHLQGAQVPVL